MGPTDEPKLWDDRVTFATALWRHCCTYVRLTEERFAALRRLVRNLQPKAILGTSHERERAAVITKRFGVIEACMHELLALGWEWSGR